MDLLRGAGHGRSLGRAALVAALMTAAGFAPAPAGAEAPRVLAVTAATLDSSLVCEVTTRGLPDLASRETLLSGLPSALVFGITVRELSGRRIGGRRAVVRVEPDLWENRFVFRTPLFTRQVSAMRDVERLLAGLGPLPVIPLDHLDPDAAYRVHVRLAVYPLAPSETRRSRGLLTGQGLDDPDRREVSVGLGALLKFFLGRTQRDRWISETESPPFRRQELAPVSGRRAGGP